MMRLPSDKWPGSAIGPIDPESGFALDVPLGLQQIPPFWAERPRLVERIKALRLSAGIVVEDDLLAPLPAVAPVRRTAPSPRRVVERRSPLRLRGSLDEARARHPGLRDRRRAANPICISCLQRVNPNDPGIGSMPANKPDSVVLICANCTDATDRDTEPVTASEPQCPRCAAFRTQRKSDDQWLCMACDHCWIPPWLPAEHSAPDGRHSEIEPLWRRNRDSRIAIARKLPGQSTFEPVTMLCAPETPNEIMRLLDSIAQITFAGDWSAALDMLVDQSTCTWEFLDPATNEFSKSIGNRCREVLYPGRMPHRVVAGVGVTTSWRRPGRHRRAAEIGGPSEQWFGTDYGFIIATDGSADVLAPSTEDDQQIWEYLFTITPAEYRQ
ncbi:hypothetical protein HT102_13535 [Hoyosella sp. G463]|uniref:Uncharacterized protein n=1 Tax=Lolliginicoccus lacisalsi TaxID=2742202 RepID=A0A927JE42_9ACTN|nr:hypothetical protein [Lolliginicoccus lacisalsi]MBD8507505.1 hypothetical protein [Lolliginicoccus lacisalsi]